MRPTRVLTGSALGDCRFGHQNKARGELLVLHDLLRPRFRVCVPTNGCAVIGLAYIQNEEPLALEVPKETPH